MKLFSLCTILCILFFNSNSSAAEVDQITLGIQPRSGFCYIEDNRCFNAGGVERKVSFKVSKHPSQPDTFVGTVTLPWQQELPIIKRNVNYKVQIDYKEWFDPDNTFATYNFLLKVYSHEVKHWIGAARFSTNTFDESLKPSGITVWGNYLHSPDVFIFGGAKIYIISVTYK